MQASLGSNNQDMAVFVPLVSDSEL